MKRPLSSMAPTIVVKDGEAKLAIGAAGGSQITSAILFVLAKYFYLNRTIEHAIADKRLHHQYLPNEIVYDKHFSQVDFPSNQSHSPTLAVCPIPVRLEQQKALMRLPTPFQPIVMSLERRKHEVHERPRGKRGSVVVAVAKEGDVLISSVDPRKGGGFSGGLYIPPTTTPTDSPEPTDADVTETTSP